MALTKSGTAISEFKGGTSWNQGITIASGTNRGLLVSLMYPDDFTVSSCTLTNTSGGESQTIGSVATFTYGAVSTGARVTWLWLDSPNTGSRRINVTMSGNVGSMSMHAQAFNGTGGIGLYHSNGLANTPHSRDIVVQQNSMVMCLGVSIHSFSTTAITIDGTVTPADNCEYAESAFVQVRGQVSGNLNAGTRTCITDTIADSFKATNARIEILEYVAPVGGRRVITVV